MKVGILKRAIEETENSDHPLYRMGSVIFKGSRIISSGHNSFRCSGIPITYKRFPHTLHAEQAAILGINWDRLRGSSILVVRINQSGNFSLAFPCKYCLESIIYVGIKNIFYSNRKGEIIKYKIRR